MDVNWDDLKTLGALIRGQSLMSAAAELGVTYTTVSRRITRLEVALGQKLFERTGEGYRPNEMALKVVDHVARMQSEEHDLLRMLAGQDGTLSGSLTLTAPQLMIAHILGPTLQSFRQAHPEVSLKIRSTNDLLDLTRREADIALRVSRSPGDNLKGLRVLHQHTAVFGTQDWADRFAEDPFAVIDWIVYVDLGAVPKDAFEKAPNSRVQYVLDDMVAMAGAAQAGLGVVRMPMFLGRATPGLVQIPIIPPQAYADVWLVAHPDVWPSAKLQALRDILVPNLRAQRARFVA